MCVASQVAALAWQFLNFQWLFRIFSQLVFRKCCAVSTVHVARASLQKGSFSSSYSSSGLNYTDTEVYLA
uniref:Putative secreted protein ovary overexpressed n=1 Tax=Rhipicephalus microplus TaxID=6941 RepID=A0A6M2DBP7_RHIMP